MNTKRKKQKRAPLPKGYRWLKVGDRRVKGYMFGWWRLGRWVGPHQKINGDRLTEADMQYGPYIAPILRKRK